MSFLDCCVKLSEDRPLVFGGSLALPFWQAKTYNSKVSWILKYRKEILIFLAISLVYFILRLPNLTLQPIFADEAIYIRWAEVMRAEPTLRFVSVSDGKTPLFMWTMMPFLKVFPDPLFAGRFLSVVSGFFTLLGVFFLGRRVFGEKVALYSALIYAVVPYTVFFDRMALVDSMLSAFSIWALYFAIWLLKSQRLDLGLILGFLLGGAWLTKTPAEMNLISLPFTLVAFKFKRLDFLKLVLCWGVAVFIALAMYNSLRLGPEFQQLSARNADYIFPIPKLLINPLDPFIPHLRDIADWFPKLLTWPVLVLGVMGMMGAIKRQNRLAGAILIWAFIPLILQTLLLKTFTARYLLFSIPPLLVFAGLGVDKLIEKIKVIKIIIVILLISAIPLIFDYQLITNPPPTNLPIEERRGYFEDWTAGFGFSEIANFLIEQRKNGQVVLGTEGSFGTLPDGLYIYLDKADIGVVGGGATISAQLHESAKLRPTYFVANRNRLTGDLAKAKLLKTYEKAKPLDGRVQDAIVLYQVLP